MNSEIFRSYEFAQKVALKKGLIKARIRIQQKKKAGTIGKMNLSRTSVIMKNGAAYDY